MTFKNTYSKPVLFADTLHVVLTKHYQINNQKKFQKQKF
jgi:hypothetical protein